MKNNVNVKASVFAQLFHNIIIHGAEVELSGSQGRLSWWLNYLRSHTFRNRVNTHIYLSLFTAVSGATCCPSPLLQCRSDQKTCVPTEDLLHASCLSKNGLMLSHFSPTRHFQYVACYTKHMHDDKAFCRHLNKDYRHKSKQRHVTGHC